MRSLYEKKTYMSIQNMKKIHNLGNVFGKYMRKSNIFYEKGVKKQARFWGVPIKVLVKTCNSMA